MYVQSSQTSILQDSEKVRQEFSNLGEQEVGKLARALAARAIFGIEVLKQSTINGDLKRGLSMLDKKKLSEEVHKHPSFSSYSWTAFKNLAKHRIIPSLSHHCKELRRK